MFFIIDKKVKKGCFYVKKQKLLTVNKELNEDY